MPWTQVISRPEVYTLDHLYPSAVKISHPGSMPPAALYSFVNHIRTHQSDNSSSLGFRSREEINNALGVVVDDGIPEGEPEALRSTPPGSPLKVTQHEGASEQTVPNRSGNGVANSPPPPQTGTELESNSTGAAKSNEGHTSDHGDQATSGHPAEDYATGSHEDLSSKKKSAAGSKQ